MDYESCLIQLYETYSGPDTFGNYIAHTITQACYTGDI